MKKSILVIAAASLTCLAFAADTPSPQAAPTPTDLPRELALAVGYIQQELDARLGGANGLRLDQPSGASYPAEQQAAVRAVFGTDTVLNIQRVAAKGPNSHYTLRIPGNRYDSAGTRAQWPDATMRITVNATGNTVTAAGAWPGVDIASSDLLAGFHGVEFGSKQTRAPSGLWFGDIRMQAKSIEFNDLHDKTMSMRAEQTSVRQAERQQGKNIEQRYDLSAKRLSVAGVAADNIHLAYRLRNLNSDALVAYRDAVKQLEARARPAAQPAALPAPDPLRMLQDLLTQGASLDIDDLSASFGGGKVQLSGRVGMPSATAADLSSPERILNKLVAHFDIRLPLPALRAMVAQIARVRPVDKNDADPAATEQGMYELVLGRILGDGYARIEHDKLISSLDLRDGELRFAGGREAISVQTLLALWKQYNQTPPPIDHSAPVRVEWSDRSLDNVKLFAGNGTPAAIAELCSRYRHGKGAPQDDEEALKWCTKGAEMELASAQLALAELYSAGNGVKRDDQAALRWYVAAAEQGDDGAAQFAVYSMYASGRAVPKDRQKALAYLARAANKGHAAAVAKSKEIDAAWQAATQDPLDESLAPTAELPVQRFKVKTGYFDEAFFRFDQTKRRVFELALEHPGRHEKWAPMLSVCLAAEAPSDTACLSFSRNRADDNRLYAATNILATGSQAKNEEQELDETFNVGDKLRLEVYVEGQQIHFVINGSQELVQDIVFQPQLLQLTCSTAECSIKFELAE